MNKFKRVSSYKINEKDEKGRWTSEEIIFYEPPLEVILELLGEGPCKVIFNRVYYKKTGLRGMICVRPQSAPQNAFIPNHPDLIAVWDLDIQDWRSMKYGEIIILERLRRKDVTYKQRQEVRKIRGRNWDTLWPGLEDDSLQPDPRNLNERRFP
jgi:hypothetical protein